MIDERFTQTAFLTMDTYVKMVKIADTHKLRDFTELVEMLVNREFLYIKSIELLEEEHKVKELLNGRREED